uniref:IgG-binding virulence factor TspB family protein n=1 Tax=Conchiformibius steedae TaxID=153493 RepID=UPI0026EB879E
AKREVIAKVFANGKGIGARVLLRGLPLVGQLATAWDIVNAIATDNGYNWSDEHRNWVKPTDGQLSFFMRTSDPIAFRRGQAHTYRDLENWCNKPSSSGGSRDCSIPQATTLTGEPLGKAKLSLCGSFKIGDEVVAADHLHVHGYCAKGIYFVRWGVVSGPLIDKFIPLTEEEFQKLADAPSEESPAKWVDAAGRKNLNWSKPEVTVPDGSVAQSSTYTNEKGQAGQTRWTFSTPKGATSSTANEEFHLRPDLQPDSAEAPRIKTPPKSSTASTNLPSGETESGGNGKKPPPPSESDLCDKYPDILACQQMGEAEESIFDGLKIPETIDERTWEEDQFLPSDGQCPKPKHFSVWGKRFEVSYEPLCELMRQIRFMVLIAFILMSARIVFGGLRSK